MALSPSLVNATTASQKAASSINTRRSLPAASLRKRVTAVQQGSKRGGAPERSGAPRQQTLKQRRCVGVRGQQRERVERLCDSSGAAGGRRQRLRHGVLETRQQHVTQRHCPHLRGRRTRRQGGLAKVLKGPR